MNTENSYVDPVDAQVGGDGDTGGIAQTITSDDINAIVASPEPLENRLEQLKTVRSELEARLSADRGHEFEPLVEEVDRAIATLESPAGDAADTPVLVPDEEDRSDIRAPDETDDEL